MKRTNTILTIAASLACILSACTSTDIIETAGLEKSGNTISIGVSAPDAYQFPSTRGGIDSRLQLRYVAKLYSGSSANTKNIKAIKELLAKDAPNKIIFTDVEEGTYFVTLFADYIKTGVKADENGHYPDLFYKTTTTDENVEMIDFDKSSDGNDIVKTPVNNDNYDCFAAKMEIKKEATAVDKSITLNRAVSKIRVIDTGEQLAGVNSIKLEDFDLFCTYSFSQAGSLIHLESSSGPTKTKPVQCHNSFAPTQSIAGELFYFYTFGVPDGNHDYKVKGISFSITDKKEGYEYDVNSIPSGKLQPRKNIIYNVKAKFFNPTKYPGMKGDPSKDIRLTVSSQEDWGAPEDIEVTNP